MTSFPGHETTAADRSSTTATRPSALWWLAHAVAGVVLGGLPLVWGLVVLHRAEVMIPARHGSLVLSGGAATLFAIALFATAAGLFAHAFLTCFEPLKHRAASGAKAACGLALLLFIAALAHHALA